MEQRDAEAPATCRLLVISGVLLIKPILLTAGGCPHLVAMLSQVVARWWLVSSQLLLLWHPPLIPNHNLVQLKKVWSPRCR